MSNVWFTSDTHFSHKNIVRGVSDWLDKSKCAIQFASKEAEDKYWLKQLNATRDFATVEDHDEYILNQINKYVKPTDTLYHLGDWGMGFGWKEKFPELRARINCQTIRTVPGNHDHILEAAFSNNCKDKDAALMAKIRSCFDWYGLIKYGKIAGRSMVLCHYCMYTFPWQAQGSIMCHGHSHGNLVYPCEGKWLDIGVDVELYGHTKYSPWSAEEIFAVMDGKSVARVDHHVKETNPC